MSNLWHQIVDFSRIIGLRNRLRCPECKAVGTYKPHGGWLDWEDTRGIRRWLCKWCGFYHDASGRQWAVLGRGQWELVKDYPDAGATTPQHMVGSVNPWNG